MLRSYNYLLSIMVNNETPKRRAYREQCCYCVACTKSCAAPVAKYAGRKCTPDATCDRMRLFDRKNAIAC